jgi:hypothetical protein
MGKFLVLNGIRFGAVPLRVHLAFYCRLERFLLDLCSSPQVRTTPYKIGKVSFTPVDPKIQNWER